MRSGGARRGGLGAEVGESESPERIDERFVEEVRREIEGDRVDGEQAMGDVEEVVGSGRRLRSIVQVRAYLNRRLVGEEDSVEEGGVDMGAAA